MTLQAASAFFDVLRDGDLLGPTLSASEVQGLTALVDACARWPLSHMAYGLATAYHETAATMQPIHERGGEAYFRRLYDPAGGNPALARQLGNIHAGDGVKFAGRGYVQLTGRGNYARAELELGVPLTADPGLAMQAPIAAKIMERGMRNGWFTGRKLAHYLPMNGDPASEGAFINARRVINGTDRAALIARHALKFQDALTAGRWTP
jgi:putative chitinase